MTEDLFVELPTLSTVVPLRITWEPVFDDLVSATAFGVVVDDWHGDRLRAVASEVDYLVDSGGVVVGFEVLGLSEYGLADDDPEVWDGPRFAVPALGLERAAVGEIMLAAKARWGPDASQDVLLFHAAIAAKEDGDLDRAAELWATLVEVGDLKGVFGLGYTLYDLGRYREAYGHLRRYSEIAPANSWAWSWLGRVCERLGEQREAVSAYRQAIQAHEAGSSDTDAPEFLRRLGEGIDDSG